MPRRHGLEEGCAGLERLKPSIIVVEGGDVVRQALVCLCTITRFVCDEFLRPCIGLPTIRMSVGGDPRITALSVRNEVSPAGGVLTAREIAVQTERNSSGVHKARTLGWNACPIVESCSSFAPNVTRKRSSTIVRSSCTKTL
jgi:hypothetical protein